MTGAGVFPVRRPIRVFLVDGHEAVRQGLGELVDAEPDMVTVGTADSVEQALVRGPVARPDVAVVGVRLPGDILVCRDLRSAMPALTLLTLASFDDSTAHLHAVLAGASGTVLRQIKGTRLALGIRAVAGQEPMPGPATVALLLDRLSAEAGRGPGGQGRQGRGHRTEGLSARERHLLVLIGEGLTDRQIGRRLSLAEETVRRRIVRLLTSGGLHRHGLPPTGRHFALPPAGPSFTDTPPTPDRGGRAMSPGPGEGGRTTPPGPDRDGRPLSPPSPRPPAAAPATPAGRPPPTESRG
ncbi:response regulator transcription factor [Streptomyces sp. NBC_01317]|uniref:response regulator transcription factor n=1 Tax=Streptomyces sp. NBC_01317 TaxID=2903822 RepID=UPI002E14304D|nr:response regulator transcription factor [Streptomyces sp. NBC_01317]